MKNYRIEIKEHPTPQETQTIIDGLVHYNTEMAGASQNLPLSVIARNENGEIIGGLLGRTYWGWLHINTIWVKERIRGKGIGKTLIETAEKEAVDRDCKFAFLDTYDFQAKLFYQKSGYEVFSIIEDWPDGHQRIFMKKRLETKTVFNQSVEMDRA
jgi:ribosomal protein S18 acetylase RimI-like enzyme